MGRDGADQKSAPNLLVPTSEVIIVTESDDILFRLGLA